MIRRINLVNLFSQYVYLQEKCRVLPRAISTSVSYRNRYLRSENNRRDVKKTKYEDTFGDIDSFDQMFQRVKEDPEDIIEYEREKAALGKTVGQYIKEVKSHLDNHDYKSALKVLEVDMVNDRKRLTPFIYKVLISYNAKIGNLQEAYRLFINFKRRQGIVTGAMYTSMFNACANCKNGLLAIEKANAVTECMRNNKNHSINTSNYNVMLKAYGRHGDLPTCLKIMDEVLFKRDKVRSDTYDFLLQACISDKNSGLRHALVVWRKMIENLVTPEIYSFNLLLKCVSDCSLGDSLLIGNIIKEIKKDSGKFFTRKVIIRTINGEKKRRVLKIEAVKDTSITLVENDSTEAKGKKQEEFIKLPIIESNESNKLALEGKPETCEDVSQREVDNLGSQLTNLELSKSENEVCESKQILLHPESSSEESEERKTVPNITSLSGCEIPNLIALEPSTGSVVEFGVMTKPHDRFMLLGGMKGFLNTMAEFGVEPNLKTFTLMLNVIPPTLEAEQALLAFVEAHKIKLDTAFFNVLMKRRFFRDDELSVKACLEQMYSLNLKPDIITFGILAIGCKTHELGADLLKTLRNHGYRANTEILETLLKKAQGARDMNYVLAILKAAKEDGTDVSSRFVANLSKLVRNERYLRQKDEENKLQETEETSTPLGSS